MALPARACVTASWLSVVVVIIVVVINIVIVVVVVVVFIGIVIVVVIVSQTFQQPGQSQQHQQPQQAQQHQQPQCLNGLSQGTDRPNCAVCTWAESGNRPPRFHIGIA